MFNIKFGNIFGFSNFTRYCSNPPFFMLTNAKCSYVEPSVGWTYRYGKVYSNIYVFCFREVSIIV